LVTFKHERGEWASNRRHHPHLDRRATVALWPFEPRVFLPVATLLPVERRWHLVQCGQPPQYGLRAGFDVSRKPAQPGFVSSQRVGTFFRFSQKGSAGHQRRRRKAVANPFQNLVFGQSLSFHWAGQVPAVGKKNVDELVEQRENSAVRRVSIV
jgi:hypothetical protein